MKSTQPRGIRRRVTASLAFVILSSSLSAQELLFRWDGRDSFDVFGCSIATIADMSGDGIPEIMVGAPGADCNVTDDGAAYMYSGKDGTTFRVDCGVKLSTWYYDGFGSSLANLGDLDADGVADYVISGPSYYSSLGDGAGRVCVYSGLSGAFLYQLEGEQQGIGFGTRVAGIGDIDADGRADVLISAPYWSHVWPSNAGRVYVYSGAAGALIRTHDGEEESDYFGASAAGIGDIDADGVGDYAVAAANDWPITYCGVVFVYSGATGVPLYRWAGDATHYFLGDDIAGNVDWNGDGYGDILVGAPGGLGTDGYVFVYSGKDGTVLATAVGETFGTQFGYSVANVGDMNSDGYPEILVGEPLHNDLAKHAGRATLLSGRTLRRLYHFYGSGSQAARFGDRAAGGLDYNGDQIPDAMASEIAGNEVKLFAGNDLFLQAIPDFVTAGDSLVVDTRGGAPGALALLALLDVNGTSTFLSLQLATLDANGEMELAATVPSGLAGITLTLQSFAQRSGGKKGFVDSGKETISIY